MEVQEPVKAERAWWWIHLAAVASLTARGILVEEPSLWGPRHSRLLLGVTTSSSWRCILHTSDVADETRDVELVGRRSP